VAHAQLFAIRSLHYYYLTFLRLALHTGNGARKHPRVQAAQGLIFTRFEGDDGGHSSGE
jgi:hypothetical protein